MEALLFFRDMYASVRKMNSRKLVTTNYSALTAFEREFSEVLIGFRSCFDVEPENTWKTIKMHKGIEIDFFSVKTINTLGQSRMYGLSNCSSFRYKKICCAI